MSHAIRTKTLVVALAQLALLGGALAAPAPIDDIDSTLMQGVDDTAKSLDSNVSQKDAKAAADDARSLVDTFARIEAHYAQKPDTAEAVAFAQKTQALAQQALTAVEAKDFDAAADTVQQLTRSCKSCHDVYKKN